MPKAKQKTCRVCGCSERHACSPGCGWSDKDETLCTVCEDALEAMILWFLDARRPSVRRLMKEFRAQQRLVLDEINGAARAAEAAPVAEPGTAMADKRPL